MATVLTDTNLVAGYYCDSTGHHGETDLAKPFVIQRGKIVWLPIGKGEYGQVLAGNDKALVGWIQPFRTPVKWTPDAKLGWSKARLSIVAKGAGRAVAISEKGDILIASDTQVKRVGPSGTKTWPVKQVCPVEIDGRGAVWGYAYTGMMFGGSHTGLSVVQFADRSVKTVRAKFAPVDFNAIGDYCGDQMAMVTSENGMILSPGFERGYPAVSIGGKVTRIPLADYQFGGARGINDKGQVVGYYYSKVNKTENRGHGFVFSGGKTQILPPPAIGVTHLEPSRINNKGVIVGSAEFQESHRLYLYTPR